VGGDDLSGRQRHHSDGQRISGQNAWPQALLPDLPGAVHRELGACGIAWNLQLLLLFRIMQGFSGGGMVPVASSILVDAFPREKRGQAFAVFGVAVAVAPVVGPTLGGWLSDNVSWHWCFLINGPVG
jgi:MFS family permease